MAGKRVNRPDIITQPERGRAVANTKVRTTFTPGTVISVSERELVDLERQGLIYSRELADGETPRKGEHAWESTKPAKPEPEPDAPAPAAEPADRKAKS